MGVGFWLKTFAACTTWVEGRVRDTLAAPVITGWNMVGGPSYPAEVSAVTSTPPGIIVSSWYVYDGGYSSASAIAPGRGYWVKSSAFGTILIRGVVPALVSD